MSTTKDKKTIRFIVPGVPVSQGNHRYDPRRHRLYESTKGHSQWRKAVTLYAAQARSRLLDGQMMIGPLHGHFEFVFPIPANYLKKNGEFRAGYPNTKITKPDLSKLVRAVEDSITDSGLWEDDSQLVAISAHKMFEFTPAQKKEEGGPIIGVTVVIGEI